MGILREVQTAPAAQLVDAVVEAVDPRLVLVVAGLFIWPFAGPLGLSDLTRAEAPFTFIGRRQGRSWICGMHPGGAQRRGWPARRYAGLIVAQARGWPAEAPALVALWLGAAAQDGPALGTATPPI